MNIDNNQYLSGIYEPIERMSRDMAKAAMTIPNDEARFLVQAYYNTQRSRIRVDNQVRALQSTNQPASVTQYLHNQYATLEDQIKRALDKYTGGHVIGAWLRQNFGVGPVLAAGFLAHIDITKAPVAGHIWSYAGLNPGQVWLPGQRRPWNAELKRICWLQGQVFMKFSRNEKCYYGRLYREKKEYYMFNNERGEYAAQAAKELNSKNYRGLNALLGEDQDNDFIDDSQDMAVPTAGKRVLAKPDEAEVEDYKKVIEYLKEGKLSPAQIDARARRWTVKLFLAHLHHVMYINHYGEEPPMPYPIAHMGHVHMIKPEHMEAFHEFKKVVDSVDSEKRAVANGKKISKSQSA